MTDTANFMVNVGMLLVGVLGLCIAYKQGQNSEANRGFRVEGWEWVGESGHGYQRLLQELVGLDYASVAGLDQNSEGLPMQWAPIFEKKHGYVAINHQSGWNDRRLLELLFSNRRDN